MKLKNKRSFPKSYSYVISKNPTKRFSDKDGNQLKYYNVPGIGDVPLQKVKKHSIIIETYKPEHHPTFRLLQDVQKIYDLTRLEDRIEFLSILNLALMMDDYGFIAEHLHKITNSLSKVNEMCELSSFIKRLDNLEVLIKEMEEQFDVQEVIEERAQQNMEKLAYEVIEEK